jgi:plasmid stabilization system protein ParE
MKPPIDLRLTRRARRDINDCVQFVRRFPRGKPEDRRQDLIRGLALIRESPERNPVEVVREKSGIELRRQNVRQFAIVYSYFHPDDARPAGEVSIRAVRHWRVRNVFLGVREIDGLPDVALDTSDHLTV